MFTRIAHRFRKLCAPDQVSREISDEMRQHIELETEDLVRQGVSPDEARRRAMMAFGGVDNYTEEARAAWPLQWAQRFSADLRFAIRSLRRAPSFTLTAVIALAIGMGANATVFSAVDSVALRPLAVREPGSLYAVYGSQGEATLLTFSYPSYEDFARNATAFSDLVAFAEGPVALSTSSGDDGTTAQWALHTSDNYFSVLGVKPALGTFYQPGDLAAPVVVLSNTLWSTRFARDPRVVGKTLRINGSAFTIVGVAPVQFTGTRLFTYDPSVWIPIGNHAQTIPGSDGFLARRQGGALHLLGRFAGGATVASAQAGADRVANELAAAFPDQYRALRMQLIPNRTPINPWLAPPERIALVGRVLIAGSLLVLLIACVNVSSLLIARMTVRRQEMAVRLSLGASRGRLLQQLLTESLVLATLGAIAAIPVHLLASAGMRSLVPTLEYASSFRPEAEPRVLIFSILIIVVAAILFGLGPALQAAGRSVGAALRESAGKSAPRWARFREALVTGQALVSALVLVAGGLFARSLQQARTMDTGFVLDSAVTLTLHPQLSTAYDAERTRAFYRRLDADVAALPGVRSAARAMSIPLDGNSQARRVFIDGGDTEVTTAPVAEYNIITAGFLATLGTPIAEGREFVAADTAATVAPIIINEVLARRMFPMSSAIGKHLRLDSGTGVVVEVVGVARASMYRTLGERQRSAIWLSLDRNPRSRTTMVVRATGSAPALAASIRNVVRAIDPAMPIVGLGSLRERVSVAYVSVESGAIGALAFGFLGLVLAASGIFGITAYAVSQRRREIGLRIALGARPGAVMRMVAGRAVALTTAGALAGGVIVAFVPMGLDGMLHGVARHDLFAIGSATLLFCAVAGVAALTAARRVANIDPMRVLRVD